MPRADDEDLKNREGRYTCEDCRATFNKSEHYKRHIRSHNGEKPYACEICSRQFSRQDSLRRHAKLHAEQDHEPPPPQQQPTPDSGASSIPLHSPSTMSHGGHVSPALVFNRLAPMAEFGHLDLLADASAQSHVHFASSPPIASTSAIPMPIEQPFVPPPMSTDPLSGQVDARLFEAWLNPTNPSIEVSSLFGADWDADGAAYLNTIFGTTTSGVFSRASSPPPEAIDPQAPLLPLLEWKARVVSDGWKLKHVSSTPFRAEKPLPPVVNTKQTANALSSELKLPKDEVTTSDPVPSLDFVDLAVAQYFSRFHPSFPILHRPTFSRTTVSPLLLLSVLSIGAIYLNTPDAKVRAHIIFTRLNKLVLATWLSHARHSASACVVIALLATLGQSYAMNHGDMNTLLIWQAYHGTVLSWARFVGLFNTGAEDPVFLGNARHLAGADLDAAWRVWVDREKARRASLALVVHENELAARGCITPTAWHVGLPSPCSDALFEAPTPEAWRAVLITEMDGYPGTAYNAKPPPSSFFQVTVALAQLRIEVAALSALGSSLGMSTAPGPPVTSRLTSYGAAASSLAASSRPLNRGLGASALALWHATAAASDVDMDAIERVVGREGPTSHDLVERVRSWAGSEAGRRAAFHAARALNHAGALGGLLHESGLYAVRVAFQSALILFAFVALAPRSSTIDDEVGTEAMDLLACEVETFAKEGEGRRIAVAGLVEGDGTRRLDAMSLLLTSANLCTRVTAFGIGTAWGETLTVLASEGL